MRRPAIPSGPPEDPITWRDDGLPASRLYGDVYFSSDDGLAETRAVYLAGCGLPEAWAGRQVYTVGELGFGTGLNIAALLMLWRETRPPGARLHVFTIEAHPLSREDAARALGRWPEIAPAAQALLAAWPARSPGFHRLEPAGFDAIVDVAVMDASEALAAWDGAADAWFLDGFSPALNPAMWSDELMAAVAARSAPGARAATFTVAGGVRRALAAAGFEPEKRPGFGRKRERLEAGLPGVAFETPWPTVAVIGAGIAGAGLARAIGALGGEVRLYEAEGRGAGASGNPAALVTPALDAGGGVRARFYAQAFERATALYPATDGAVIAVGALQLEASPRDGVRFDKIAAEGPFAPGALTRLTATETSAMLGEPAAAGLQFENGLTLRPAAVLAAWAPRIESGQVDRLERGAAGWRLLDADDAVLGEAQVVILAAGAETPRLWPEAPIRPVRGQASWATGQATVATAFGGYAIPTGGGVLFGATFDRGETATDLREADHARNLALLAEGLPDLASRLAGLPLEGRARVRATTPDHLPLAGAIEPGLFTLGGLGSRGFCAAPLLAEHVAALAFGRPSPLPRDLAAAVNPLR